MLNKNSSDPLYKQLKDVILEEIKELPNDTKIKSENEYCKEFSISRITVRKAIDELVNENFLIKRGGKGTFVFRKKSSLEFQKVISFTEDMQKEGYEVKSKILEFKVIDPSEKLIKILKLNNKNEKLFYLSRVRFADNIPMAIQNTYVISKYCPNLMTYDFSKASFYKILRDVYNLDLKFAENILKARLSNNREKKIFNLNKTIAVFYLQRTTYLADGIPIEFVESIFRSDKYNFVNIAMDIKPKK